jgi:hypothetical protein
MFKEQINLLYLNFTLINPHRGNQQQTDGF